jgi:general secretion pathway protein I
MMKYNRGFTLLEVMVALVILATVMTGVFTALSSETRTTRVLQEKSMGLWIAQNVLQTYQLHGLGMVSAGDTKSGTELQYQQSWTWHLNTVPSVALHVVEVTVQVQRADTNHSVVTLTGYANEGL